MQTSARSLGRILAAAVALAGCTRDLDLPDRSGPSLSGVAPEEAYAGEWLEIAGSGFAADPAANLVQFGSASARGEGFSGGGGLLLRVPPDAGSGQLTVATARGTSAPVGPFRYLGLGELRTRQIGQEIPLLHKPYRVFASGGETLLDSDLVVGVLRYDRPDFVAPFAESAVAFPGAGVITWYEDTGEPGGSQLVRVRLADDHRDALPVDAGQAVNLVALAGPDRVAVVRRARDETDTSPALPTTVTVHDAATLAVVAGPSTLPLPLPHGCADAGGGRLACVYHPDRFAPGRLALFTPPATTVTAGAPAPLHHNDFDLEEDDPLCVAQDPDTLHRVAVVGGADGRLLLADLDAGALTFTSIETGSSTPAQSLTCPGGPTVLVAKTADDLLLSVDLDGTITWAVHVPGAARAAVEGDLVHVAGDANDVVELRELATGALRARRAFDPMPGRDDGLGLQAVIWSDTGYWGSPGVLFSLGFPRGLMEVPVQATSGATHVFPKYLGTPDAVGVVPGIVGGYLALRDRGLGEFDLGHDVQLGLDAPRDYHAGTWDGLVTVDGLAQTPALSPIAGAQFRSLDLHPAGGVWAAVNQWEDGAFSVRRWTEEDARAGAPATFTWSSDYALDGAALLGGTLWAFYWDHRPAGEGGQQDWAIPLDERLAPGEPLPLGDYLNQLLAVSPNGRTFVSWESQPFSEDTSVVVWSADPGAAFPRLATIPIEGQVTGAAFDRTGEALYVTARGPGRVVVIE